MNNKIGRLKHTLVYLGGSIDFAPDLGIGWREKITPWLENRNIKVINPCNKWFMEEKFKEGQDFVNYRNNLKESGDFDELSKIMKEIRHIDLRLVDYASWLLVYIDMSIPHFGTIEEFTWANRCKKPSIIICKQGKKSLSDWAFGCIPHTNIFNNFNEAKEYIRHIDEDNNIDDLGRWVFMDYEKLLS